MGAGPSKAVRDAQEYLKLYPATDAKTLSMKFGVHQTTITRSAWYKNRAAAQPQTGEK